MAGKINGYGRGGEPTVARARAARVASERAEQAAADRASEARRARADEVRLTDSAAALRQAEARLKAEPDVDAARVDALRKRVESGEYRVDADRLAARLIRFERSLT